MSLLLQAAVTFPTKVRPPYSPPPPPAPPPCCVYCP